MGSTATADRPYELSAAWRGLRTSVIKSHQDLEYFRVRQLTGLQKLQVFALYPLRSQDLLGLSNLQQLTSLECAPVSADYKCAEPSGSHCDLTANPSPGRVMRLSN
jgi:hypothetical protein